MNANRPGRVVYIARDQDGEWATVVVGADPEAREEVATLLRRLGWEMVDITDALTPGMLRRMSWTIR